MYHLYGGCLHRHNVWGGESEKDLPKVGTQGSRRDFRVIRNLRDGNLYRRSKDRQRASPSFKFRSREKSRQVFSRVGEVKAKPNEVNNERFGGELAPLLETYAPNG